MILGRCNLGDTRHEAMFNAQDGATFWYEKYNMAFPPNYLHNRQSAHYIEINNIFFTEMMKKYVSARKEILTDRDEVSDEARRTRYATNPNYIYEAFKNDTPVLAQIRMEEDR